MRRALAAAWSALAALAVACGGAQTENARGAGAGVTNAPAATVVASTNPPAQCAILADPIDAFTADVAKVDAKTSEGLHAMSRSASSAATDLGAAHIADETLAAIAHDTSAYLRDTSGLVDELGAIIEKINTVSAGIQVDAIKTCVTGPAYAIGVACKGKTSGDCPAIAAMLDAWGRAPKNEEAEVLARVRALQVTEPAVKGHYAAIVTCVKPLATALDEVERSRTRLRELDQNEDHREREINTRFKAICGRDLFTK